MALGTTAPGRWINGAIDSARNAAQGVVGGAVGGIGPTMGPPTMPATPDDPQANSPTPTGPPSAGYESPSAAPALGRQAIDFRNQRDAFNQAQNYAELLNGPQQNLLNFQRAQAERTAMQQAMSQALDRTGLQNQYSNNMARLGLQEQGLGLDRQGNQIQRGMLGLDREGLGVSRKYIGQMMGVSDRDLASTLEGIGQNLATDQRNTTSDYTSRGSYFAPFHRLDLADNYATALRGMSDARRQREAQQYGYDRDLANIGLDDRRIDYRYQDLGLSDKRLDLEARKIGLSRDEYEQALDQGLAQLGLQGSMSADQLAAALYSNDAQQAELAQQILMSALMYSGNPAIMGMLGNIISNMPPSGS